MTEKPAQIAFEEMHPNVIKRALLRLNWPATLFLLTESEVCHGEHSDKDVRWALVLSTGAVLVVYYHPDKRAAEVIPPAMADDSEIDLMKLRRAYSMEVVVAACEKMGIDYKLVPREDGGFDVHMTPR